MKRNLLLVLLVFLATTFTTFAAPKLGPLAGVYQGNCDVMNTTGDYQYYGPVRLVIKKNGAIAGTAFAESTGQVLQVTGKLQKVKVLGKVVYQAVGTGRFSDGTTWRVNFQATKQSGKSGSGTAVRGDYRGRMQVTG